MSNSTLVNFVNRNNLINVATVSTANLVVDAELGCVPSAGREEPDQFLFRLARNGALHAQGIHPGGRTA